jgi:hypothetical protein
MAPPERVDNLRDGSSGNGISLVVSQLTVDDKSVLAGSFCDGRYMFAEAGKELL